MLTGFAIRRNIFSLAEEFNNNYLKLDNMKKLAMILAVAFTMGLATSTVTASTKDEKKKEATAACSDKDKKACATTDKKACCSSEKKAEAPAEKPAK